MEMVTEASRGDCKDQYFAKRPLPRAPGVQPFLMQFICRKPSSPLISDKVLPILSGPSPYKHAPPFQGTLPPTGSGNPSPSRPSEGFRGPVQALDAVALSLISIVLSWDSPVA